MNPSSWGRAATRSNIALATVCGLAIATTARAVEAIKQLKAENEALRAELDELRGPLEDMAAVDR